MNRRYTHVTVLMLACLQTITIAVETAQTHATENSLPIIDVHAHAFGMVPRYPFGKGDFYGNLASANPEMLFQETYERFRKYNVVKAVVSGDPEIVETWKSKDGDDRIIRGIVMGRPNDHDMNPVRFESLVKAGKIKVYGELLPSYLGTKLSDPEWQPYLRICEQYDIPVCVHTGTHTPGVSRTWVPNARYSLGDPYLIEDILVIYPELRVYMAHAGGEWHEHALVIMQSYPNLYVDISGNLWACPLVKRWAREFLAHAKEAGYLDRVMFGSDQAFWPHAIEMSIDYLNSLEFLTDKEKRDIFYNNAARFLRLTK